MANPLYSMVSQPDLDAPVLVMALKGWIDAGLGAEQAAAVLTEGLQLETVARFDPDALLDWRARRPVMHLSDGVNTDTSWEDTELRWARDPAGNDLLLLLGNEPDHAWLAFSDQVVDLALDLGTRLVFGLGAYPAPVPHTRSVQVAAAASSPELTEGLVRSTVEAPSGVQSLIERRAALRGLPALGLWAQVPHYVAAMPYPAASLVLLETVNRVAGLALPTADLGERAQASRARIDQLIGENPEHLAMLHQLEQQADEQDTTSRMAATSGDELAAELERFLRDQG
ncbi:MAG TPA: PAC2 family protein [Acidimicrobiales bacterium]|nr:PAC2 family protein [Acidimicrobiales bacterium]